MRALSHIRRTSAECTHRLSVRCNLELFSLQLKLQSHVRRYNKGAWPRLVELDCDPKREYRFLKGAYNEKFCEYDCIEAYLANMCGCATLTDRRPPYDALPACNYTRSSSCVLHFRELIEKAESRIAPMPCEHEATKTHSLHTGPI